MEEGDALPFPSHPRKIPTNRGMLGAAVFLVESRQGLEFCIEAYRCVNQGGTDVPRLAPS